jgi:hypothetical protein
VIFLKRLKNLPNGKTKRMAALSKFQQSFWCEVAVDTPVEVKDTGNDLKWKKMEIINKNNINTESCFFVKDSHVLKFYLDKKKKYYLGMWNNLLYSWPDSHLKIARDVLWECWI